jgi:hypothetical protein
MRPKCTACNKRRAPKGFKRCDPCRTEINAKLRARVARRRRQKLCKCGRERVPQRKSCQECLDYFSGRMAELQENRRLDGLCPKCGHAPKDGNILCDNCLANGRAQWAALPIAKRRSIIRRRRRSSRNERPENVRKRVAECKARWRAEGRCVTCGKSCEVNSHTNEPYAQCSQHRKKSLLARTLRLRRRAA